MQALRSIARAARSIKHASAGAGARLSSARGLAALTRAPPSGTTHGGLYGAARHLQPAAFSTSARAARKTHPRDVSVADISGAPLDPSADDFMRATFADPVAAGRLLFTGGLLWEAAQKDAAAAGEEPHAYLARVSAATLSFRDDVEGDGLRRVVGCPATLAALRRLGDDAGEGPQLVTGPRSVGKSLMLEKVAAQLKKDKRQMLVYDCSWYRTDLVRGFVGCMAADPELLKAVICEAPLPVAATIVDLAGKPYIPDPPIVERLAGMDLDDVPRAELGINQLLDIFIAACQRRGEYPVIAIDEANRLVRDAVDKDRTVSLMQYFTRISKQERQASVVLATTDHRFPDHLRRMGYNTGHMSSTVVVDEVPPAAMKRLLEDTWGCGEHLASTLLQLYGGHVVYAAEGVFRLTRAEDPASMQGSAALCSMTSAPSRCWSDCTLAEAGVPEVKWAAMRKRMREVLRALAVDGFVPLESPTDDVAVVASVANVGRVVGLGSFATSVPLQVWDARTPSGGLPKAVLVPAFHIMRLLIANQVSPDFCMASTINYFKYLARMFAAQTACASLTLA